MRNDRSHHCELPEDYGGLSKLPPNAPCQAKFLRYLRKLLAPNPKANISKRNYRNQSQINTERRRYAQSKYVFVIHPYSDLEFYREIMFIFIGVWEIVTSPLNASFGYVWKYDAENRVYEANLFNLPNMIALSLELIWILSCFFSAYKEPSTKIIELNHWKIVKRYFFGYFLVDLLFLSPPIDNVYYQKVIYWINALIFLRLHTLMTFLKRFLADLRVPDALVIFMNLITISCFMIHVLACIFYVLPLQFNEGEEELWIIRTKLHPHASLLKVYFSCYCMVQTHFWGLGEASLRVQNVMENLILIVTMIVGRLWSLYLLATMLRVFTISSLSESKYEEYLLQLRTFITQKQIPGELADRLIEYYRYKYQHHYFNERAIFSAMSTYLKQELLLYGARNVISKVSLFKHFPRSLIGSIIAKSKVMVFLNHDVIVHKGDLVEYVYFISCGTVAMYNSEGIELAHLSDGEEVGIKGVITLVDTYHDYTFISIDTTEIYVINLKDFRSIIYTKGDVLKFFSKRIEERARDMEKIDAIASAQGTDLLSALRHGKVLERPRIRTRYFDL